MTTRVQGFTGRHMLLVITSFFAVVISVNVTMAWFASSSWSGLVVENTYVASQEFNHRAAEMKAMTASGIAGHISLKDDRFIYRIGNRDGSPAEVDTVTANFKRPVGDHEDFSVVLDNSGNGMFETDRHVPAGDWIVEFISKKAGALVMHEAIRFDTAEFVR